MSFQTRKIFVHLWNTNQDIFDEFRELSDPPIDSKDPNTIKAQKCSKEIFKIIHVTSVVQPWLYKASRILFVCKENKNKNFIQQFVSSASHYSAILESITYVNNVCNACTRTCFLRSDQSVNNTKQRCIRKVKKTFPDSNSYVSDKTERAFRANDWTFHFISVTKHARTAT